MGNINLELPEAGEPRGTSDTRIRGSLIKLREYLNELLNAENKVLGEKLAKETLTAEKLAANAVEEAKIKDGAVTSRKAKLTAGSNQASGNLGLTGEFVEIPGTALTITPAVPSLLLVSAVFDFYTVLNASTLAYAKGFGGLVLDGIAQSGQAVSGIAAIGATGAVGEYVLETTPTQAWCIPLTAAEHKIHLSAKKEGTAAAEAKHPNTGFTYLLVSQ